MSIQRSDELFAAHDGIQIATGPTRSNTVVTRVDVIRADLKGCDLNAT